MKKFLFMVFIFLTIFYFNIYSEVSGKTYIKYSYDLIKSSKDYNSFDITRLYLTYKNKIYENTEIRATTDVKRDTNGYYFLYVKYLYVTFKNVFLNGLNILAGQQDTLWIGKECSIWEHRHVSDVFMSLEGFDSSSDLGFTVNYKNNFVDFKTGIFNGEGYNSPEINKFKTMRAQMTLNIPFIEGLKFHGLLVYGIQDEQNKKLDETNLYLSMLSYQHKFFTFAFEYFNAFNQTAPGTAKLQDTGIGGFTIIKVFDFIKLFSRVDILNTDKESLKDGHIRVFNGVTFKINEKTKISLVSKVLTPQSSKNPSENELLSVLEVKF